MTRLPFKLRSAVAHFVSVGLFVSLLANSAFAQGAKKPVSQAQAAKVSQSDQPQPVDKEYTESILKNTTEKFFLTELVDHMPASDKVPTPAKVLGYPIGTPNKLT
ncbi:MAG TPA: hypothetical protein PLK30_00105, partial [Blastocatellia bacterium]|nr:hypothetical protein [Blastocatellia bacterium]